MRIPILLGMLLLAARFALTNPTRAVAKEPSYSISGTVSDAATGKPIPSLLLWNGGSAFPTDAEGRYHLSFRERVSTVDLRIMADRGDTFQPYANAAYKLENTTGADHVVSNLNLPRGVTINGRVIEKENSRPIVAAPTSGCHISWPGPLSAGAVEYYPLATNEALKGTPISAYFVATPDALPPAIYGNIDGQGRFRIAVPPGPGVLLVYSRPGMPPDAEMGGIWPESDGLQKLFPYQRLEGRRWGDGAPWVLGGGFIGLSGPISFGLFGHPHAYQVIDPKPDVTSFDLTFTIARAPSRKIRFVDPDGQPVAGVTVRGLTSDLPGSFLTAIILEGPEAEVSGLEPRMPRTITAYGPEGKLAIRTFVMLDDADLRTIHLQRAGTVTGRLLDALTGQPLVNYSLHHPHAYDRAADGQSHRPVKTDVDGRFALRGVIPDVQGSIWFSGPDPGSALLKPKSTDSLVVAPGEVRDLGDIL